MFDTSHIIAASMLDSPYHRLKSLWLLTPWLDLSYRGGGGGGENRVSVVDSIPDPPYEIGCNFKLRSCGANFHLKEIKVVFLVKKIKESGF